MEIEKYINKRDKLLRDLDIDGIIQLSNENGIEIPESRTVILASMHKIRYNIPSFNSKEKSESKKWLLDNNFTLNL